MSESTIVIYDGLRTTLTVSDRVVVPEPKTDRTRLIATSPNVTPNPSQEDIIAITAQATALVLNNPTMAGTKLIVRIRDNGSGRALTFGTQYRGIGTVLPNSTLPGKTMYLGFLYNATDSTWDMVAKAHEV